MGEQQAKPVKAIAFIGTGIMGASMAAHLLGNGYKLNVYNRTKARAQALLERGAVWHDTPGEAAAHADIVITMLGYPSDVEEVYFGSDGVLKHAKAGALLIDMTTSSPELAKRIGQAALERGFTALDAPVSGGDVGARNGNLSIMVGGPQKAFGAALPVLCHMGVNIVHQGEAGAGQFTKMCNQIAIASTIMGVSEALVYARAAGLEPAQVLKSIESGAAGSWTLSNLGPRMINHDYAPGFYVKHFIKDIEIAIASADELGLQLPGLALAKQLYNQLVEQGQENSGTQAIYQLLGQRLIHNGA